MRASNGEGDGRAEAAGMGGSGSGFTRRCGGKSANRAGGSRAPQAEWGGAEAE